MCATAPNMAVADRHRWSVRRDERARCGLLDHSGEVAGRSDRVGEARSEHLSERRGGGRDPKVSEVEDFDDAFTPNPEIEKVKIK